MRVRWMTGEEDVIDEQPTIAHLKVCIAQLLNDRLPHVHAFITTATPQPDKGHTEENLTRRCMASLHQATVRVEETNGQLDPPVPPTSSGDVSAEEDVSGRGTNETNNIRVTHSTAANTGAKRKIWRERENMWEDVVAIDVVVLNLEGDVVLECDADTPPPSVTVVIKHEERRGNFWIRALAAHARCADFLGMTRVIALIECDAHDGVPYHVRHICRDVIFRVRDLSERALWLLTKASTMSTHIDGTPWIALYLASELGNAYLVAQLLLRHRKIQHSAHVEDDQPTIITGNGDNAPLYTAACASHLDRTTALEKACELGHVAVVQLLLRCGADAARARSGVEPALCMAAKGGHGDIVLLLLAHSSKVNQRSTVSGKSPLVYACAGGWSTVVRMLLNAEADMTNGGHGDQRGGHHVLPLLAGAENGREDVVRMLLAHKASAQMMDGGGQTALHKASEYGFAHIISLLVSHQADVNFRAGYGHSPLQLASKSGKYEAVSLLLRKNANVKQGAKNDKNALHEAAENGHSSVVRMLIEARADVNRATSDSTPITLASNKGHAGVVHLLREDQKK
eukprot:GEMP01017470.1.p1 GENE.GEMP01017470.1~~GEMP01017470.1.p1  ORF type:complete len:570 (+),score=161.43 GEMP01017470.1:83-1792(+)